MFNWDFLNILGHKPRLLVLWLLALFTLVTPTVGWSDNGFPTPSPVPVKAKSTQNPSGDLSMSPQEEIQVLDAIDDGSNTATAVSKVPTPLTATPQASLGLAGTPQPTVAP